MKSRNKNSIFLPPEKHDGLQFMFFGGLTYSARLRWYAVLVAAGLIIQVATVKALPGAFFLICAAALITVRGLSNRVPLEKLKLDRNWTAVDMQRIHEIKKLGDRIRKWDTDALDITNVLGFVFFLAAAAAAALIAFALTSYYGSTAAGLIFLLDAVILVFPLWFNGTRRIYTQDNLQQKIAIIREMEAYFRRHQAESERFVPALMLARDENGKSVPVDARFVVTFAEQPEGFYGLQAQISMNTVQGTAYPYFYCVLPAQRGYGLNRYLEKIPAGKDITVEMQSDPQTEVIVIRQTTTKNAGYFTRSHHRRAIFDTALTAARMILRYR